MTNIMRKENGGARVAPSSFTGLVDQIFQDNLGRFFDDTAWGFNGNRSLSRNQVPVNVQETDKSYELDFVAPGLKKEDFKISVNGDLLTVAFEHKEENNQESKEQGWLRKEFRMQSFTRSFSLDDSVDMNKIAATYRDGLLHLSLPKKEGAQKINRTIEIQ